MLKQKIGNDAFVEVSSEVEDVSSPTISMNPTINSHLTPMHEASSLFSLSFGITSIT